MTPGGGMEGGRDGGRKATDGLQYHSIVGRVHIHVSPTGYRATEKEES